MLWLLLPAALAADPSVSVGSDGTIVARVHVPANEAQVREALSDPVKAGQLSPEVLSVASTPSGTCEVVTVQTQGAWDPLNYRGMRCPTETGWRTTLLDSDDFSALDVEWKLVAAEGGTDVEYRVKTEVDLAVPQSLVRKGMERSARNTLLSLLERVVGR